MSKVAKQLLAWHVKAAFVLAAILAVQSGFAGEIAPVGGELESAILAEDWDGVLNVLDSREDAELDAAGRFIKGHACLAVNRNNESLCMFLNATKDDLEAWKEWTSGWAMANAGSAIANYFLGDALARSADWDFAFRTFDRALGINPKHFLTLNARGVSFASKQRWNEAVRDFAETIALQPDFSDVYTNRGAMYIQMQSGAPGALRAFNQALAIVPDFFLALNGRGAVCVVLGNWESAEEDLLKVDDTHEECLVSLDEVVAQNLAALASSESNAVSELVTQFAGIEPGFSIDRKTEAFSGMSYDQVSQLKGVLNNNIPHNQWYAGIAPNKTTMELGVDLGTDLTASFKVGGTWNEYDRTTNNLGYQQESLDLLNQMYPDIHAQNTGNIGGFLGSRGGNYAFTHSDAQGVSTKGVDAIPIDPGDWHITTVYGLYYPVNE